MSFVSSSVTPKDLLKDLTDLILQRRILSEDDDDDESGTWDELPTGERVTVIFITILSLILCFYFCYYIKCRKELPTDRIPLTAAVAR
jgi:hypothetical protein